MESYLQNLNRNVKTVWIYRLINSGDRWKRERLHLTCIGDGHGT